MTHNVAAVWQPSDMIIMFLALLVFFSCFGFALWKASTSGRSTTYWQMVLCIALIGVAITSTAAMTQDLWDNGVIAGTLMLATAILMTLGGALHSGIRAYVNNRLQQRLIGHFH
ncbi:hypothetical protein [Bartonella sp. HY038]|uniref:hypothetical protein n=1 Tax=Bartonella sp. HY038 TaxID=2759660 RepID=UPI0015FC4454|nr:hypothetical protein [Bartonella sp. HY038]